jgi:hypothetical protein
MSLLLLLRPTTTVLAPDGLVHARAQGNPAIGLGAVRRLGNLTVTTTGFARPDGLAHTRGIGDIVVVGLLLKPTALIHARAQGNPLFSGRALPPSLVHARTVGHPSVNLRIISTLAISRA